MTGRPSLGEALAAYLSLGKRKDPWPGTDEGELIRLVGDEAPELKRQLDTLTGSLTDLPDAWRCESLQQLGDLAAERAKQRYPEFSEELCQEIGRLCT